MKRFIILFTTLIIFSCNGVHLNINYPSSFNEGEIQSVKIKNDTLEIIARGEKGRVNITISPWREIKYIKLNLEKMKLKTFTKISPSGPSKAIYFFDKDKLVFAIANKVNEFFSITEGYSIKEGNPIEKTESGLRLWCDIKLKANERDLSLKPGEIANFKNNDGNFTFILIGASIPNPEMKKDWIADESPKFIADYIIINNDL